MHASWQCGVHGVEVLMHDGGGQLRNPHDFYLDYQQETNMYTRTESMLEVWPP